ncbi:DUF349 domain-containing protein [Aquimarina sp. 2201CG5-10]|uniref:DUF349 domain-containing protein n=1 Tax=Aquimarina callyspongiae TaxID=3098150 RepID=UPI002AB3E918|nr:DUF349 domain-containing protein [Aquimarina sp. 2201CG5-10]MDY8133981.1 DUF349 domain-containing protein [Aquimarina sp. 2201CG5-10]
MSTSDNLPKADGEKENKIDILETTEKDSNTEDSKVSAEEITSNEAIPPTSTTEKSDVNTSESETETSEDNSISEKSANEIPAESKNDSQESPQSSEDDTTEKKEDITTDIDTSKETAEEPVGQKNESNEVAAASKTPEDDDHLNHIDEAVAEDSEDESTLERHDIVKKDYHSMDKEELIKELRELIKNEKIQAIKEHVEEIKTEFNEKFNEEVEQKKEEFLAEGGDIIDFYYSTPVKKAFNSVYFDYKEKRNSYYQNLKKDLQENLKRRLELIDELKGLLNVDENINTTYNHFKSIQERWRNAGPIPRDKYNTVWNTYHHHTENFYDFLHLNREFRDLDFKHNLEQKLKIIERATELAQETDVNRAFRELQLLHKMWKEDLGPVGKEYREPIWEKFSSLTRQIHENRQQYFKQQDKVYEKNLEAKNDIIAKIIEVSSDLPKNHNGWQQKIKEIEALREDFFKAGKVPSNVNEETWGSFKSAVRDFNRNKNAFYKNLKKGQFENLNKKMELIKIAEDNKDNDDFTATTPLMKKIQSDWKKIGHVPRKDSDRIWKKFKDACNSYFDRLHAERNEANKEELIALEKKQAHIEALSELKLSGDPETDLKTIKDNIAIWKTIGRVPYKKKNIEAEYNKALDELFKQLNLSRKETELIKYENKLSSLSNQNDDRALRSEQSFIRKKIDEVNGEIRQLENNLQFFKNAKDDNPLVLEVQKNIAKHRENLEVWKAKLIKIKQL